MHCIYNGKIIHSGEILTNSAILFTDTIEAIVDEAEIRDKNYNYINAHGAYIAPGFIDLHIHGYNHVDTMDGTEEAIQTIAKGIAQNGVTSFLPTTMSMPIASIKKALDAILTVKQKGSEGADVLGAHMEGPYINSLLKGAQNEKYIVTPTASDIAFVKEYKEVIKLLTISPEIEGALTFIDTLSKTTNITLSMGHTHATYEQTLKGIEAGISHTTHLFNAMTPLHHRDPGVVGAALTTNVSCELIADTIHVNKGLFPLVTKTKAPDKLILVTDCMCAGGCPPGEYALGGQKVLVDPLSARLEDGTLAGSILKLNVALRNILQYTDLPLEEAISFVSLNPAKIIQVDSYKGSLDRGKDADIVLFDEAINVQLTIRQGEVIYQL